MIEIKITLETKNLDLFKPQNFKFADQLNKVIEKASANIRNTAKSAIQRGGRTGSVYKNGKSQRSAPGQFPKSDTGRLVASIRNDLRYLEAEIGSDVVYSSFLQEGTKNRDGSQKIAPRPWLTLSYETWREWLNQDINDVITKAFNL